MKKLILILSATAFLGACSSAKKKQDTNEAAPTATEKMKDAKGKAMKGAKKAVDSASSEAKVECKSGADVRTIEIKTTGTSCEVVYTKAGQAETKASGLASSGHCGAVLEKMKGNLTGAGFTCN